MTSEQCLGTFLTINVSVFPIICGVSHYASPLLSLLSLSRLRRTINVNYVLDQISRYLNKLNKYLLFSSKYNIILFYFENSEAQEIFPRFLTITRCNIWPVMAAKKMHFPVWFLKKSGSLAVIRTTCRHYDTSKCDNQLTSVNYCNTCHFKLVKRPVCNSSWTLPPPSTSDTVNQRPGTEVTSGETYQLYYSASIHLLTALSYDEKQILTTETEHKFQGACIKITLSASWVYIVSESLLFGYFYGNCDAHCSKTAEGWPELSTDDKRPHLTKIFTSKSQSWKSYVRRRLISFVVWKGSTNINLLN
jgi:hypothetical protein